MVPLINFDSCKVKRELLILNAKKYFNFKNNNWRKIGLCIKLRNKLFQILIELGVLELRCMHWNKLTSLLHALVTRQNNMAPDCESLSTDSSTSSALFNVGALGFCSMWVSYKFKPQTLSTLPPPTFPGHGCRREASTAVQQQCQHALETRRENRRINLQEEVSAEAHPPPTRCLHRLHREAHQNTVGFWEKWVG